MRNIVLSLCAMLLAALPGRLNAQYKVTAVIKPVFTNRAMNNIIKITGQKGVESISLRLGNAAVRVLDKVEIYGADTAGRVNKAQLLASAAPGAAMHITFNSPYNGYVMWLSVRTKANAALNSMVPLQVTEVERAGATTFTKATTISSWRLGVVVREKGQDSVHTYRIPGLTTGAGDALLGVYDVRYKHAGDLPADIDVGMSKSLDGGSTWQPMQVIMSMGRGNTGIGDPAILYDGKRKTVWVAALWSKGNNSIHGSRGGLSADSTGQLMLAKSTDNGKTWTKPYSITPQVKDPAFKIFFQGPGTGMVMRDGTLVFPAQYWDAQKVPYATIIYSKDGGRTWHAGRGAKSNTTESTAAELQPGVIMLNMRDNRGGYRSVYTTADMGNTWKEHATSYNTLTDPVCMGNLLKGDFMLKGKKRSVLLFSNVDDAKHRINMTVKGSLDNGNDWPGKLMVDERPGYGYSALTKVDDYTAGLLYEGEGSLYYVKVPVAEIFK